LARRDSRQDDLRIRCSDAIYTSFLDYLEAFNGISRRARQRFQERDWSADLEDGVERLELWPKMVGAALARLEELGAGDPGVSLGRRIKRAYTERTADVPNLELAQTFFSSVSRRLHDTVGVDERFEYVSREAPPRLSHTDPTLVSVYAGQSCEASIRRILDDNGFDVPYEAPERDSALAAAAVSRHIRSQTGSDRIDAIEVLRPLFYRDKAAYIIGRIRFGDLMTPLVLPLHHRDRGIVVDAALMSTNQISILFSFARSYFHVEADRPGELIAFLRTLLPQKPIDELYISLGFDKHGKTELFRGLMRHVAHREDRFRVAEGARGMVMLVFTLGYHDKVFKVIRDRFDFPKKNTRREVLDRYRLVFEHDRVGRLVDAQEFEHLRFRRELFADELLDELLDEAGETVSVEGDELILEHLYTERKVVPLNLYIDRAGEEAARRAVIDYGHAIRELAASNIFPGDFLLKNFGVTRHGRVVFYDYDELCFLTDCNFRKMPEPRYDDQELESEPWFTVDENDIFPEEFRKFLGLREPYRSAFVEHHADLFDADFWRALQKRHRAGEVLDFFPYPRSDRLQDTDTS
jgi:isocitrate dehydrogenase kinase/phosphatase